MLVCPRDRTTCLLKARTTAPTLAHPPQRLTPCWVHSRFSADSQLSAVPEGTSSALLCHS